MQYLILSKMWEIVGNNGSLIIALPYNSHNETRLYVKQLHESGFDVISDIDDSEYNFMNNVRINKKIDSSKILPKPNIFRTIGGIQ
jgi:hypothetical protein